MSCTQCALLYLSLLVPDPPVELLPVDAQKVFSGVDDATFDSDGSCRVDVVSCHHTHSDSSTLALQDGVGHLRTQDCINSPRSAPEEGLTQRPIAAVNENSTTKHTSSPDSSNLSLCGDLALSDAPVKQVRAH